MKGVILCDFLLIVYPPRKIRLTKHKGSAALACVIVFALVSSMLGLSTAKVTQAAMNGTSSNQTSAEAAQIAQSDAELLRSVSYQDVAPSSRKAVEGTPFQHEMTVSSESDFNSSIKQKTVTIKVFKGTETNPRSELRFTRYSVESTSSSVPQGSIIPWFGSPGNIPNGFALCDGKNGTPDLRNRFIVGAGDTYKLSDIGGEDAVTLEPSQTSSHYHTFGYHNANNNGYFITTASKKKNASLPSGTYPAKWNGSGGGGWYGWDGSGWAGGQNLVTSLTVATEAQKPHENRPPYYALHYIMKL